MKIPSSALRTKILLLILAVSVLLIPFRHKIRSLIYRNNYTVTERLAQYEERVKERLGPSFQRVNADYPPPWMGIVAIKDSKKLELWVESIHGNRVLLREYPILAASGKPGPKLREGDYQVPEGIYKVESLNPNSLYHLSLRVNYPNDFDRQKAKEEGRANLGGDIMIHGSNLSIGCLAVGDDTIEDIFVLAAKNWPRHIPIVISPVDFRKGDTVGDEKKGILWRQELYQDIQYILEKYTQK